MMNPHPTNLFHLVRQPLAPSDGKPPLLLLLHGVGSNEEDLFALAPEMDPRVLVISARGRLTLRPGSYAWYHVNFTAEGPIHNPDEAEESRQTLARFINEIVEAYGADPNRVYVMGFSQGGAMTGCLASTVPEKIAGAVIMSGRTIPEMKSRIAREEELGGLPVLVVHGTEDRVLAISYGRELQRWFSDLPVDLTYQEYPMAHEITKKSLGDIKAWLRARLEA
jgi:phospholipase/carboxylesterase